MNQLGFYFNPSENTDFNNNYCFWKSEDIVEKNVDFSSENTNFNENYSLGKQEDMIDENVNFLFENTDINDSGFQFRNTHINIVDLSNENNGEDFFQLQDSSFSKNYPVKNQNLFSTSEQNFPFSTEVEYVSAESSALETENSTRSVLVKAQTISNCILNADFCDSNVDVEHCLSQNTTHRNFNYFVDSNSQREVFQEKQKRGDQINDFSKGRQFQSFSGQNYNACHSNESSQRITEYESKDEIYTFLQKKRKRASDEDLSVCSFAENSSSESLTDVSLNHRHKRPRNSLHFALQQTTQFSESKNASSLKLNKVSLINSVNSVYEQVKTGIEDKMKDALPAIQQLKKDYKVICDSFAAGHSVLGPEGLQQELMPYQWFGYKWMEILYRYCIGGCLADGMGLGKTIQTIALIQAIINEKQQINATPRILISCPANLISNWERELKLNCPHLQNKIDREKEGQSNAIIDLISHQKLRLNSNTQLKKASEQIYPFHEKWDLIVIDEFHTFLSSSPSEKTVKRLRNTSQGFIALTGTPMPNNLLELYKLNAMLNPNIYPNINIFKNKFIKPAQETLKNLLFQEKIVEVSNLKEMEKYVIQIIEMLVQSFLLRRQNSFEEFKSQTAMMQLRGSAIQPLAPLQSDEKIFYPFTKLQDQLSTSIINFQGKDSTNIFEQGALSLFNATKSQDKNNEKNLDLKDFIYLQQIANHPSTLLKSKSGMDYMREINSNLAEEIKDEVNYEESGKLQTIISLVKRIVNLSPQDKILIFTNYEQMGHLICNGLHASKLTPTINKVKFLSGTIKKEKRSPIIDDFQSLEGPPVLIVGRKLGSVGWNCVNANHLVIVDPWWNPNDDDQCIGRLHRIGQTKPVHVYRLHQHGFVVDHKMENLRIEKKAWCELILSADTNNVQQRIQEILGNSSRIAITQAIQFEEKNVSTTYSQNEKR